MKKIPIWKIVLSITSIVLACIFVAPNFRNTEATNTNITGQKSITFVPYSFLPSSKLNLGLDLKGGSHMLLEVDFDKYLEDSMEMLIENIRKTFRVAKIGYKNLKVSNKKITFEIRNNDTASDGNISIVKESTIKEVKKLIHSLDKTLGFTNHDNNITLIYDHSNLSKMQDQVLEQSIEIIRMRVDSTGTTEPVIQRQGDSYILLQVPGEQNPENLKRVIGQTAKLTFHFVDEDAMATYTAQNIIPSGDILVKAVGSTGNAQDAQNVLVKKQVLLSGDHLVNAQATFSQYSQPVIAISFNNIGSKIFADITKNHKGQRLAIVLDHKLLCAPSINEPILGGNGVIQGNFTVESANELALLLRAGALPAPLKIIEERTIGPSLGSDSIASGKKAAMVGFIGVVIFMTFYYGILGIFANIALSLALLYIMALLSLLQATLTLPGIAGIILTIGMAVDANVLIYERIREELKKGASNLYAIKQGFDTAFGTIADSNITTLIVAFLLYVFGIGAIKGFAVTLTIGIISSMFSAIVITKLLIDIWVIWFKPKSIGLY